MPLHHTSYSSRFVVFVSNICLFGCPTLAFHGSNQHETLDNSTPYLLDRFALSELYGDFLVQMENFSIVEKTYTMYMKFE